MPSLADPQQLFGLPSPVRAGAARAAATFGIVTNKPFQPLDPSQKEGWIPGGSPLAGLSFSPTSAGPSLLMPTLDSPGPLSSPLGFPVAGAGPSAPGARGGAFNSVGRL